MAHFPKLFFRPARSLWYVQINGKQVNLGADKDVAFKTYHWIMERGAHSYAAPVVTRFPDPHLVVVLVDDFLDWCERNRDPESYLWYKDRLTSFCKMIDASFTTDELRQYHVQKWVDARPNLASGSRRNLITSVKRAMKWAEEQGYIDRSPLRHMRKPAGGRKEQVVTIAQYNALLERTKDQNLKDLLTTTWETGCRPQESLRVEARHVDLAGGRWVFPVSESKGARTPRIVHLTRVALEIATRLIGTNPKGPLFRYTCGKPWKPFATSCRFRRAKKHIGVKVSLYALRNTFATNALMKGIDCITVSTLMGHADPGTLAKVYQHLAQNPTFLKEQVNKAIA